MSKSELRRIAAMKGETAPRFGGTGEAVAWWRYEGDHPNFEKGWFQLDKPDKNGIPLYAAPAALPDGYVAVPAVKGMRGPMNVIGRRLREQLAVRFFCASPVQFTDNERQVLLVALKTLDAALNAVAQGE